MLADLVTYGIFLEPDNCALITEISLIWGVCLESLALLLYLVVYRVVENFHKVKFPKYEFNISLIFG